MIKYVYDKNDKRIDVETYKIKENIKSGANIAKKAIIINDDIVINKNYKVTYICSQCRKEYTQKYQKCFSKLLTEKPLCPTCSRKKAQSNMSRETIEKRKQTHIKRYGKWYSNPESRKKTNLNKYGDENYCNIQKANETKLKKYGNKNNYEKIKQTNLEKYGVKNTFQLVDRIKQTNLERYGVEYGVQTKEIKEKIKQTNLERYGVENVYQSEKIKEKIMNNNLKLYGVEYNWQREDVKQTIRQTNLEKYGVEYVQQSEEIKEKIKQTNLERYGIEYGLQNEEIRNKIINSRKEETFNRLLYSNRLKDKAVPLFTLKQYSGAENYQKYLWKCKQCGTEFEDHIDNGHIPRCPICYPPLGGTSKYEKELYDWFLSLGINNIIKNDRTVLCGKELDLYLPDYNLAIEFNGLYWHSELQGKNQNYHLEKTLECEKYNIQLIHIFEDEWLNKQDIVKSIIRGKLRLTNKLYARKCIIKEIDNQRDFLDRNHLQGHINSSVNIGLYYNNELISCLSLGKPRYNKRYDWEILRFANKLDTSIIGGFAKMLSYFKKHYNGTIITYSDRRYFDGSIYRNNGFEELSASKPNYFYTDYKDKYNRVRFQKHKLEEQLELYDSNLTEWENMQLNGWDRIWDCGHYIFYK
ncbi:MAG: DUF7487 domain-containing protein [Halanaerobiales bacterium]